VASIERVIEIVEHALELSSGSINPDSSADNIDAWDSLGQISILVSLDRELADISERIPEIATARSIREIFDLVARDHGQ
jgi:acyl carrier protein